MKTAISLICLSVVIFGCTSLGRCRSKPSDGYARYRQACEYHKSLGHTGCSAVWEDFYAFLREGEGPSRSLVSLILQEQKAFALISDAHNTQDWKLPDITTFSAETRQPYISSWHGINRAATVQAIQLYRDGRPQDALSFLLPFNTTGMKLSKAGTLIQILVHIACRTMHYPVLASSIDLLPEASLAEELDRANEQYAVIPTVCESMAGERHMAINTAKGLFADLRAQLKRNREMMVQNLKEEGIDHKMLKKIDAGEEFSVAQWENAVLSELRRLQEFYTNALVTRVSSELGEVDDEIEAKIEEIGSTVEHDAAMAAWNLFMANQISDAFSMPEAKRLHSQVGKAISHQFLIMMMPAVGSFGIRYREFIASERLLLTRLAVRLYTFQNGQRPSSLQQLVDEKLLKAEMIIDPLSGKEFLTKTDNTLEAYSVGRDLDDDNGIPWNNKTESGDTILIPLKEK